MCPLKFAAAIRLPSYRCHVDILESVPRDFLLFSLRGLEGNPILPLPPYENRFKLIGLPTLEKRR